MHSWLSAPSWSFWRFRSRNLPSDRLSEWRSDGALAGHQVHHGLMGAVGGCVAGHYAHKHAQSQAKAAADAKSGAATQTTDGANAPALTAPETAPTKP